MKTATPKKRPTVNEWNEMLRVDRGYATYLRARAKREGITVCELTRRLHRRAIVLARKRAS